MKNTNFSIPYDEEKLSTILVYAKKKNIDVSAEVTRTLDNLYNKVVPSAVREYFVMKADTEKAKQNSNR